MNKRELAISEYRKKYSTNYKVARDILKKLNYKDDHELLALIAQSYLADARFNNDGTNKEPYDRRMLRYAERYVMRAFNLCPTCSNVLWTLGQIRADYRQNIAAIYCYEDIIEQGVRGISKDSCKNKKGIILSQINDSKFQLYRLHIKKDPALSKRYLKMYKNGLKKGISTLYKPLSKYLVPKLLGR